MNKGALCISFGSPSMGFTDALGRIFSRVRCKLIVYMSKSINVSAWVVLALIYMHIHSVVECFCTVFIIYHLIPGWIC